LTAVIVALLFAALVTAAAVNSARFGRRVRRDVAALWEQLPPPRAIDRRALDRLPPPVRTYFEKAVGSRTHYIRAARLRHGGTFRPSLDGGWLPIRGQQYFALDPPGFVWWGRVRIVPGVWIDARDRSVRGAGNMLVSAESSYTIADSSGPELDQGALLRLLGEMAWFPTVFLDERYVSWSAIDDRTAKAALTLSGRVVAGIFSFGDDGLPAVFSAERYRDLGNGKSALTPFTGRLGDFRLVDGLLVPHMMVAAWVVDGQEKPYVRFSVERIEFDVESCIW
jgi:uncharacterized protein DUF6544